ncbi:MAG: Beta-monoglucosyldiacylglycerol synthase [Calditrichaeota bacterium]|nr:Beta-monoglucosyldiacylglycerol synthase [Calditrichota bacterium]
MTAYYMITWCAWLVYSAFMVIVYVGLRRLPRTRIVEDDGELPFASIVIAARDEETRIGRLLDGLEAQDYPRDKFEVIVVDDRSRDRTGELVRGRARSGVRYRVVRIRDGASESRAPKKYALSRGIALATGEVIVTTDADCWMGPRWLRALLSPFTDPEVQGVTGVSRFIRADGAKRPWWSELESLEHLSYSVMAAGSIAAGHVTNAHGSNLAARRSAYERIGGYASNDRITSGDDVFLLQDIAARGGAVRFVERPEAYVFSQPVDTLNQWVNQRARWSSKGFYYPPFLMFLVVGTFLYYLMIALSLPLALVGRAAPSLPVLLALSKIGTESVIMRDGMRRFQERYPPVKFLLTQILHAPAIFYAGFRGQFFKFKWKSQTLAGRSAAQRAGRRSSGIAA